MRASTLLLRPLALTAALGLAAGVAACTDDEAPHDRPSDTGLAADTFVAPTDTGTDTASADGTTDVGDTAPETEPECYTNPKTHYEIINACTDAAKLDKAPTGLPFLPDGGLPPP